MNYKEDIINKLRKNGFISSAPNDTYKHLKKDDIKILVVPSRKKVFVNIKGFENSLQGIESIEDLNTLHRLIYGKTEQIFINNEEGD